MPAFVLEVASDNTWRNYVVEKVTLYSLTGVQEYLVFDPTQEHLKRPMRGWHRDEDTWSEWEAVRPEGLLVRFDHPQHGPLPLRRELAARLTEREQELQEAQRQLAERDRTLAELQEELRRLHERER